jgi:hypothetical protein
MKRIVVLIMFYGIYSSTAHANISFFDGDFNPANWNSVMQTTSGSFSTSMVLTGGNPGGYMRVDHQNFTGDMQVFHFSSGAVYDPGIAPIQRIGWSIDEKAIQSFFGIGVAVSLAIEQDGIRYAAFPAGLNNGGSWVTFTNPAEGFVADNFWDFPNGFDYPSNPGRPDFSSNGSPIRFGFCTHNNNTNLFGSRAAGFDNWSISVITTPEPATMLLLGLGGILLRSRKKF